MGNWNYIKNIAVKNIKMILHSSRFYIVLFAVFACLSVFGDKLPEYLAMENSKMGIFELLPVFLNSRLTQLVIYLGWILLVSELPFFASNQTNILIRTNRKAVLGGCIGYIILLAMIYVMFLQLCTMGIMGIRNCIITTEWSGPLTMAAQYGANMIGIRTNLLFDFGIVKNCTPIEVWGVQITVGILLFILIGLILFCGILLREHFFIGHLLVIGLWAWDFVIVEFIKREKFLWLSPVSMAKSNNLSFCNMERGPSVPYVLVLCILMIILLFLIGYTQIEGYDFSKE